MHLLLLITMHHALVTELITIVDIAAAQQTDDGIYR